MSDPLLDEIDDALARAAREIETLRAENDRLREALEKLTTIAASCLAMCDDRELYDAVKFAQVMNDLTERQFADYVERSEADLRYLLSAKHIATYPLFELNPISGRVQTSSRRVGTGYIHKPEQIAEVRERLARYEHPLRLRWRNDECWQGYRDWMAKEAGK